MNLVRRLIAWFRRAPVANTEPNPGDLFALMNMAWIGQAVFVAAKLGVADHLAGGPKTSDELATLTESHPGHVQQIMRALAGFGIFAQDETGRYTLTPLAEPLVSERESWLLKYVLLWGEQLYPACGELLEMTTSGRVAYEIAHGKPLYEHYKAEPQAGARFVEFMNAVTDWQREVVVHAFEFSAYHHIVDVGGGRASMLTRILQENPYLRGTILDQPHMKELISARIRETGLAQRCEFAGGSFLDEVVAGADLYLIKHVLHDWANGDVVTILRNIYAAMADDATLVIIEGVLDERNGIDRVVKMRDLEQMIWTGGKVRSQAEFTALLSQAGFRLTEVRRTALLDTCLLLCHKAT